MYCHTKSNRDSVIKTCSLSLYGTEGICFVNPKGCQKQLGSVLDVWKTYPAKKPTVFAAWQRNQRCKTSRIFCQRKTRLGDILTSVQFGCFLVIGLLTERICFVSTAEVSKTVGFLCRIIVAGPVSALWSSVTVNVTARHSFWQSPTPRFSPLCIFQRLLTLQCIGYRVFGNILNLAILCWTFWGNIRHFPINAFPVHNSSWGRCGNFHFGKESTQF